MQTSIAQSETGRGLKYLIALELRLQPYLMHLSFASECRSFALHRSKQDYSLKCCLFQVCQSTTARRCCRCNPVSALANVLHPPPRRLS